MKALDFSNELGKLKISYDVLRKRGFSNDSIIKFINHYDLKKIENSSDPVHNPIEELLTNYHTEGVEIGEFYFAGGVEEDPGYLIFGYGDGVDFAIRRSDGRIVAIEGEREDVEVAIGSEEFLDALLHYAKLYRDIVEFEIPLGEDYRKSYAEKCSALAGGESFSLYWTSFCE